MSDTVKANKHVVIVDNSKNRRCYFITPDQKINHYKSIILTDNLIGKKYNSIFLITDPKTGAIEEITDSKQLVKDYFLVDNEISDEENQEQENQEKEESGTPSKVQKTEGIDRVPNNEIKLVKNIDSFVVKGDNRNFTDDQAMQKFTQDKIAEMKQHGSAGAEIIEKLKQNSSTFNQKTQFSKEKWLRKKEQKYMVSFEIRRPECMELCEAYFQNNPEKICYLRPDMLGYILNYSNVNSQSKCLLVENTKGLMAGALIERGAQYTLRVEFYDDESIRNKNDILFELDQTSDQNKNCGTISASLLAPLSKETDKNDIFQPLLQKKFKKTFSSFIFVHDTLNPEEVFESLKILLQPSASFAIHSSYIQPLVQLLEKFHQSKDTVNAKIEELWTRELQVFPLRTHPFMSTNGRSGYVLTGQMIA